MSKTVLVTGGTGFVAGWQIAALLNQGYRVRTTVRGLDKEAGVRAAVATVAEAGDRLSFFVADLLADAGWHAAVADCDFVLHVASPLGGDPDQPAAEIIATARDGALRVVRAAADAGVRRIVLTSSTAACAKPLRGPDSTSDETVWTDVEGKGMTPYRQSKVIAERAAWDLMAERGDTQRLTTVLPSAIFGPILSPATLGSVMVVGGLLRGMPGYPKVGFSVVDVRDLAVAHILAMTSPAAAGQRFIACSDYMMLGEVSRTLRVELGEAAAKAPTRALPDFAVRLAARTQPALRGILPTLGRRHVFSSAKAQHLLAWKPRPATETVVDTAHSLIAHGVV